MSLKESKTDKILEFVIKGKFVILTQKMKSKSNLICFPKKR